MASFWDYAKGALNVVSPVSALVPKLQAPGSKGLLSKLTDSPDADIESQRKRLLQQQAAAAAGFAGQGERGYAAYGQQGQGALTGLQRLASGQDSVSAEQLRQGVQQGVAAQRSAAAGAAPANAAMAARTAAIQSGRLTSGLAGQQALAGLQERAQAQGQYAQLLQGLRGQDLNAALGSRQTAVTGYGAANAGTPAPSLVDKYGPLVQSAGSLIAASDRRLKTDIKSGDEAALKASAALQPYTFLYRDPRLGEGKQLGTMTDDLKRAGLGQAVIPTPGGEVVDGAKLALANTAMIAALARQQGASAGSRAGTGGDAARRPVPLEEARLAEDLLYKSAQSPSDARAIARPLQMARQRIQSPYTPSNLEAERWLSEYVNGGRR